MQQLDRVHAKDLTSDGKLRRRFEIDEPEDKKHGVKFASALLFGNAILILKSILFPSSETDAKAANRGADDERLLANAEQVDGVANAEETEGLLKLADPDTEGFEIDEIDLDLIGPVSSGSAVRSFAYDDTISFNLPTVPSETQPLLFGARSGQVGSNVVSFPAAAPPAQSQSGGGGSNPLNSNNDNSGSPDTDSGGEPDEGGNDNGPPSHTNRLPTVASAITLPSVFINQSVVFGLLSLLQGAQDADADELHVIGLTASSGTVTANDDSTWIFKPDAYSVEEVTFSYEISDGEGSVVQTATLEIVPIPGDVFLGSDEGEVIVGTPGADRIEAMDGDDTILAREDNDFVDGGGGADRIITGQGDDIIYAGDGDDVVYAGDGNDTVFGGDGDDIILGEDGEDTLFGEDGNDVLLAGAGDDRALGGAGNDVIQGEEGDDLLDGGDGADAILAGVGNDIVLAGAGDDTAHGDDGDDIFIATLNDGDDSYDGGSGIDTVSFASTGSGIGAGVDIDLAAGTAVGAETGTDELAEIENVVGSASDDIIAGDAEDNELTGGAGSDVVHGDDGDDTFVATIDDGNDVYNGGSGTDTISFAATTADTVIDLSQGTAESTETGSDLLSSIENVIGGQGNDEIVFNSEVNIVSGGGGDDSFFFEREHSGGRGRGARDVIEDFSIGDRLDFTGFRGSQETDGWQRLTFVYDEAEFSGAGQIRFRYETFDERDFTIIEIKTEFEQDEGDEFDFDMDIELVGRHQLNFENLFT